MKKKISICLSLLLSMLFVGCTSSDEPFKVDDFICELHSNHIFIYGYEGTSSEITIPKTVKRFWKNYNVMALSSLSENKYIKKVTISNDICIEGGFCKNCSNLREIEIIASIIENSDDTRCSPYTSCGLNYCFEGTMLGDAIYSSDSTILYGVNPSLDEFTVSNKTKVINSDAFINSNVKKVHIPNGVEKILSNSFNNCKYLTTVDTICTYKEPRRYTLKELVAGTELEGEELVSGTELEGEELVSDTELEGEELVSDTELEGEEFIPGVYLRNLETNLGLKWDGSIGMYVDDVDDSNRLPLTIKQLPRYFMVGCPSIEEFKLDQFEVINSVLFSQCEKLKKITINNCKEINCAWDHPVIFSNCPSMKFLNFEDNELESFDLCEEFKNSKIDVLNLPISLKQMNFTKIAEMNLPIKFLGNDRMIEEIENAKRQQIAAQKRAEQQTKQQAVNNNSNSSSTSSTEEKLVEDMINKYKDLTDMQNELTIFAAMYKRRDLQGELLLQKLNARYTYYKWATTNYIKYLKSQGRDDEAIIMQAALDDVGRKIQITATAYQSLD